MVKEMLKQHLNVRHRGIPPDYLLYLKKKKLSDA